MYLITEFYITNNKIEEKELELINKKIKIQNVSKGQILQRKGELANNIFFVRKGLLRSYTIDNNGKEHIFMFAPEGWLIADNSIDESKSDLYIDAIEDSEIEICNKNFLDKLIDTKKEFGFNGNKKLINRVRVLQKRIIMLMSATAWERYQDFIETYPNIVQRVSQKMIASYLGITPEALSKLRSIKHK